MAEGMRNTDKRHEWDVTGRTGAGVHTYFIICTVQALAIH